MRFDIFHILYDKFPTVKLPIATVLSIISADILSSQFVELFEFLVEANTTFVTATSNVGKLQVIREARGAVTTAGRREKRCSGNVAALLEGYERRGATRALRLV